MKIETKTMYNGKTADGKNILASIMDENGNIVYQDVRTDAEMIEYFDKMFEQKKHGFKNVALMEKLQKIFNSDYNELREYELMQFLLYKKPTHYKTWLRIQLEPSEWNSIKNPDDDMTNDLQWFFD